MFAVLGSCRALDATPEEVLLGAGEVTWTVSWDDAARADGAIDCTYTRRYTAIEDRSTPWLCPQCDVVVAASVAMDGPDRDCYHSVSAAEPSEEERLGWDEAQVYRAGIAYAPLDPIGERVGAGADELGPIRFLGAAGQIDRPDGAGRATLWVEGAVDLLPAVGDPWGGMAPPERYRCGWEAAPRAPYAGDWRVAADSTAPDGWFHDRCDESVRLHDLAGFTVIELAAVDCAPCQGMASEEAAFEAQLGELDVQVVTLLVPSLSDVFAQADAETLEAWSDTFSLDGPVLADRGWGYAVSVGAWGELAYPAWFVVDPAGRLVGMGQGYTSWDAVAQVVRGG